MIQAITGWYQIQELSHIDNASIFMRRFLFLMELLVFCDRVILNVNKVTITETTETSKVWKSDLIGDQ